jgi:hypothetical protein
MKIPSFCIREGGRKLILPTFGPGIEHEFDKNVSARAEKISRACEVF